MGEPARFNVALDHIFPRSATVNHTIQVLTSSYFPSDQAPIEAILRDLHPPPPLICPAKRGQFTILTKP